MALFPNKGLKTKVRELTRQEEDMVEISTGREKRVSDHNETLVRAFLSPARSG